VPEGFDDPVNIEGAEFEDVIAALLQVDPNEDAESTVEVVEDE
jgi:hypothetical protein